MYQPPLHREDRLDLQHALIKSHPFGLLVSQGPEGLLANGLPFILQADTGKCGTLQAHMARANAQWKNLEGQNVLVIFQGPQSYISLSFYETKRETGKVVPTWNYVMVQARGVVQLHQDAAWLDQQIEALTRHHEDQRNPSWKVSDAPRDFIESQLRGIVGLEIEIQSIEGKWKVSQNRNDADRAGVVEGLFDSNPAMAEIVRTAKKPAA